MNKNDQQFTAQKIRAQYTKASTTELDELKNLDAKVKRPANVFAYTFGSIGALIMGSGMSLVMTDIDFILGLGEMTIPGIVIGIIGMAVAIINYPIYNTILKKRKEKYSEQILSLSDKIMNK
ncbi:MAG: dihydropteridine reductase [Clostridia bacterium]|nr:dihydropteridine reductase [Clostridia bacterium]